MSVRSHLLVAILHITIIGCSRKDGQHSNASIEAAVQSTNATDTKVHAFNEAGFAKITCRQAEIHREGIVDTQGKPVVQVSSRMLVSDITGSLALVQFDRKFLFVPLDRGYVSSDDLDGVGGFQYAEPYRCGLALVSVDGARFYIDANFEKAFNMDFEFAESFHHDRALVHEADHCRIIDTQGNTVADLNYDQVNPQSPWCWQVTKIENEKYRSGFVDLDGKLITELIYDYVGYYDQAVDRIPVVQNALHGFLDGHAKVVIPLQYEYAEVFERAKARVVLNGRTFFINPEGVEVPE